MRQGHKTQWAEHKRDHHARRYEQALEHEALDETFYPTLVREKRDREDDVLYSHFTDFDQLLELKSHEEYLRARRAWDRRHGVQDVELNIKVQSPDGSRMNGAQVWALCVGLFFGLCFIMGVVEAGPFGLLFAPLWFLLWAVFTRIPLIYTTGGSVGGTRGASGSAV